MRMKTSQFTGFCNIIFVHHVIPKRKEVCTNIPDFIVNDYHLLQVLRQDNPLAHFPPPVPSICAEAPQGCSSDFAHSKQHPHSSKVYIPLSQQ